MGIRERDWEYNLHHSSDRRHHVDVKDVLQICDKEIDTRI